MANGAALRTEAGLGPCGAFGMEVRSQLTAADLWDQEVAAFGTSVLGHVARLEPQPAFVAFPWLVDLLRPSIRALLDSEKVDEAGPHLSPEAANSKPVFCCENRTAGFIARSVR